ncbi:tyrosine-type recombinase/integrase [Streptomyces prasinopilosus]|uniref:tyrosine-type recombinase/integrase n=1 Tax=Streptomyces prasinopilosus TaxID=67344 RepID=UPI000A60E15C|nr:tyrosine-type recombinase/integrase [Streptomyces prasinopilosus]
MRGGRGRDSHAGRSRSDRGAHRPAVPARGLPSVGTGQRTSEVLAFSAECLRSGFVRIRWQVSAKAHRSDSHTVFVPLKHRTEGEYRDVPAAPFVEQEIDAHLSRWEPVPMTFPGQRGKRRRLEVFFAPRRRGKGEMPTASTYGYHFRKVCVSAGLIDADDKAKYTPGSLRHFFASIALANGVPIREVSRWLGRKSIKTTVDIYGHLVPEAWDRCRDIMQNAMRHAPCALRPRAWRGPSPPLDVLDALGERLPCWIGAGCDHLKERFRRWELCTTDSASTCSGCCIATSPIWQTCRSGGGRSFRVGPLAACRGGMVPGNLPGLRPSSSPVTPAVPRVCRDGGRLLRRVADGAGRDERSERLFHSLFRWLPRG